MSPPSRLAVRPGAEPAALRGAGIVALPVAATKEARALEVAGALRLFVAGPDSGETAQLRLDPGGPRAPASIFSTLPALPLALADAACCGSEILVTGADPLGRAVAVGLSAADGSLVWRREIQPKGFAWPLPGCARGPVLVSQGGGGAIEIVAIAGGEPSAPRTVAAGGSSLSTFALSRGGRSLWAAWGHAGGIHAVDLGSGPGSNPGGSDAGFDLALGAPRAGGPAALPRELAVATWRGGVALAWLGPDGAFLALCDGAGRPLDEPARIDLGDAEGGRLRLASGPEPLAWVQRGEAIEGEPMRWTSILSLPGSPPATLDGLIHDVAWWGERVVAVGEGEILILDSEGRAPRPEARP
ncbi:MAG TPA: hypothetical protein VN783_13610 [Thermoanaerobaculia bacterium]|nr:hypothetical protein [Thermoanaerobaculia bacterium]